MEIGATNQVRQIIIAGELLQEAALAQKYRACEFIIYVGLEQAGLTTMVTLHDG